MTAEKPAFNTKPNAFLTEIAKGSKPGVALDVGMGQGAIAFWLAQQGWDVTGFDPAEKAVGLARKNAAELGVKIKTEIKERKSSSSASTAGIRRAKWLRRRHPNNFRVRVATALYEP